MVRRLARYVQLNDNYRIKITNGNYELQKKFDRTQTGVDDEIPPDVDEKDGDYDGLGYHSSVRSLFRHLGENMIKDEIGNFSRMAEIERRILEISEKLPNLMFVAEKEVLVVDKKVTTEIHHYYRFFDDARRKPQPVKTITIEPDGKKFETIATGKEKESKQLVDILF